MGSSATHRRRMRLESKWVGKRKRPIKCEQLGTCKCSHSHKRPTKHKQANKRARPKQMDTRNTRKHRRDTRRQSNDRKHNHLRNKMLTKSACGAPTTCW